MWSSSFRVRALLLLRTEQTKIYLFVKVQEFSTTTKFECCSSFPLVIDVFIYLSLGLIKVTICITDGSLRPSWWNIKDYIKGLKGILGTSPCYLVLTAVSRITRGNGFRLIGTRHVTRYELFPCPRSLTQAKYSFTNVQFKNVSVLDYTFSPAENDDTLY